MIMMKTAMSYYKHIRYLTYLYSKYIELLELYRRYCYENINFYRAIVNICSFLNIIIILTKFVYLFAELIYYVPTAHYNIGTNIYLIYQYQLISIFTYLYCVADNIMLFNNWLFFTSIV